MRDITDGEAIVDNVTLTFLAACLMKSLAGALHMAGTVKTHSMSALIMCAPRVLLSCSSMTVSRCCSMSENIFKAGRVNVQVLSFFR